MNARFLSTVRALLVLALALCGAGLAGGCHPDAPGKGSNAREDLGFQRLRWAEAAPEDYVLRVGLSCFCGAAREGPLYSRVTRGQLVDVWREPGHRSQRLDYGMTVEDLFSRIASGLDNAATLQVDYDAQFGYPQEIAINVPGAYDGYWGARAELLCGGAGEDSASACDCTGEPGARLYDFAARDSGGVVLAAGCLALVFSESPGDSGPGPVSGRRCLRTGCVPGVPPAFAGAWNVGGSISPAGEITLDLNSGAADFNIFLSGHFARGTGADGEFAGDWSYSTIVGPQATGRFTATPRP